MAWEFLTTLTEPVLEFADDLFLTNEEEQGLEIAGTTADAGYENAIANQTNAEANLIAANDAATFTEDEQRQLLIIIISIIVISLIIGMVVIIKDTK